MILKEINLYRNHHKNKPCDLIKKWPKYCYNDQKTIERDNVGDVIDIRYRWRKAFKDGSGSQI